MTNENRRANIDADYTSEFVFTAQGASEDVGAARLFITSSRHILKARGWLE